MIYEESETTEIKVNKNIDNQEERDSSSSQHARSHRTPKQ